MPAIDEVSQRIGGRMAELRREAGKRQEDVATEARSLGLNWTQSTIAALETGRRELGLDEFFLLPLVFHGSCEVNLRLADLLPGKRTFTRSQARLAKWDMKLSPRIGVSVYVLKSWLDGYPTEGVEYLMSEGESARIAAMRNGFESLMQALPEEVRDEAWTSSRGEAERKAARSLGIPSGAIGPASYLLWGHSLASERDARTYARRGESQRSTVARRGHVTRQLLAELRVILQQHGIRPEDKQGP